MIGTVDQARSARQTSMPSMSGSPRSSSTTAGLSRCADARAALPVGAATTLKPRAFSAALTIRVIARSSSTSRKVSRARSAMAHRDGEVEPGAAGRLVLDVDVAAVGLDDGAADGEPDAARLAARPPAERLEELGAVAHLDPVALVRDPDLDHAAEATRPHLHDRPRRGVAGTVL